MTALSRNTLRRTRGTGKIETYVIATAATLYEGSIVMLGTTAKGRLRAGAGTASHRGVGVVEKLVSTTGAAGTGVGNTAGTERAIVKYGCEALVAIRTAVRTNAILGVNCYLSDDNTVCGTAVGTAAVRISPGHLTAFEATDKTTGWLALRQFVVTSSAI